MLLYKHLIINSYNFIDLMEVLSAIIFKINYLTSFVYFCIRFYSSY